MNTKTISLAIAILLIGTAFGRYLAPTKTITKTETVTVVKEVEKKVDDSTTHKKNDKDFVVIETVYPDGRRVKETHIVDKGTIVVTASSVSDTKKDSSTDTKTEKVVERKSPVVIYGVGSINLSNFTEAPDYGVGVQKQLIGPFWFGGQIQKSGTVGITLGIAL